MEYQKKIIHRFREAGKRWIRPEQALLKKSAKDAYEKLGMEMQVVSPESYNYIKSRGPKYWTIWRKKVGPYGNELLDKAIDLIKNYKK